MIRDLTEMMQEQHKPILLRGIWRTGNTSIMRALAKEMGYSGENADLSLNLSMRKADFNLPRMSLLDFLEKKVYLTGGVSKILGCIRGKKDFSELKQIEEELKESGISPLKYLDQELSKTEDRKKALLVIDEATVLLKYPEALQEMNSWGNFNNIMVIANMHRIGNSEELIREELSNFEQVSVRNLTLDETKKITRIMMPDIYKSLSGDDFEELYSTTGGHPYELVMLCTYLKEYYSDNQQFGSLLKELTNPKSMTWQYLVNNSYDRVKEFTFSDSEKVLIKDILEGKEMSEEDCDELGEGLAEIGILKKEKVGEKHIYKINGSAFEGYLKNEMNS